jgi:hypothetical protein
LTYVLSPQSDADLPDMWPKYMAYLDSVRDRFPPSAWALAKSDWYFDFRDHRCPHDAWLEELIVLEAGTGARGEERSLSLHIRLLGPYHDGHIELRYPQVFSYRLAATTEVHGHGDWRYDEFRLSENGHLLHEIEWWTSKATGTWLIEASDIEYRWIARAAA